MEQSEKAQKLTIIHNLLARGRALADINPECVPLLGLHHNYYEAIHRQR